MTQTCYMCDNPATSMEHVPPKGLFPEKKDLPKGFDFRKNLIRVPSCDKHNSHKSKDDEYLIFILAATLQGNEHQQEHFRTKVMRAVHRKPHVYASFTKDLRPVILQAPDGQVEESATFKVDKGRFDRALHHIACGIFYQHHNKKWLGAFSISTNLMMAMDSRDPIEDNRRLQEVNQRISDAFEDKISIGENKEIFSYRLLSGDIDKHAVHLVFYEEIEITVLLRNA